jgi:threonylcarbamoyladenosine tRNA methylthiotransferase MtaB
MNLLDSTRVAEALRSAGHEQVDNERTADVVLVNSCTVTAESDRKSRRAAHAATREGKRVIVMGCGPRVDRARWRRFLPQADLLTSDEDLPKTLGVEPKTTGLTSFPRTRLPIPIQHGCDNTCAYCITRFARGPHRSEPLDAVIHGVEEAIALGMQEVVLTGINLAAWGCLSTRSPHETRLPELIRALLEETSIPRIRLSSLGPEYLHEDFFDVFRDDRVCDHLHLSVQSGSPSVLRRMERGHGVEEVLRAAERARQARRDVAITADFIVGLPGETEEDFAQTMELVQRVGFARLHVFPFSPREGTAAFAMPDQVSPEDKKRRSAMLRAQGRRTRATFVASQLGRTAQAIVHGDGTGLTSNYLRLRVAGRVGALVEVVIRDQDLVER